MIDPRFALLDHHGRRVTERDFRGRWMLVYFGFTHCRVVCPRSLAKLSAVLAAIGDRAARIAPLYVTVDPARDTAAVMKAWLAAHHPRFTGLTGTPDRIDAAKAAFRVFAQQKPDADDPDGYAVPHTAIAYLIDPAGRYRTHFADVIDGDTIAARIAEAVDQEDLQPMTERHD